jgi:hypothetical protein
MGRKTSHGAKRICYNASNAFKASKASKASNANVYYVIMILLFPYGKLVISGNPCILLM